MAREMLSTGSGRSGGSPGCRRLPADPPGSAAGAQTLRVPGRTGLAGLGSRGICRHRPVATTDHDSPTAGSRSAEPARRTDGRPASSPSGQSRTHPCVEPTRVIGVGPGRGTCAPWRDLLSQLLAQLGTSAVDATQAGRCLTITSTSPWDLGRRSACQTASVTSSIPMRWPQPSACTAALPHRLPTSAVTFASAVGLRPGRSGGPSAGRSHSTTLVPRARYSAWFSANHI